MNALGFSKNEREINRHHIHLYAVLENSFGTNTSRLAGSTSEGICGGIYNDQNYHKMHHNLHCHVAVTVEGC
jgi:hypothetical protein